MKKFYQEITNWDVDYRQPNHVYLMSGDRAYAYSPWGESKLVFFNNPRRIDRRGRKFKEVPNTFNYVDETPVNPYWVVQGSRGNTYTVEQTDSGLTCTCTGYKFRGKCKHLQEVSEAA